MQNEIPEATLFAPLRTLGEQLRTRRLSPIALTEAYLARLQRHGERLGAVVTITRELALQQARAADEEIRAGRYRGPLHGIPYGAKDLLATRDIRTTWGAEPYRQQVFDHDATVVRKLQEAGAILVAKLAMIELAGGFGYNTADASFTGPTRNPWNRDYWAGGSSSGSAAAVAAGLVAFAIGSETSGSIITPATFCGLTGLRPTYGRVSRHGAMALCWTLDKLGPICRGADDCGLVLAAIAGADTRDPTSRRRAFAHPEPALNRPMRLGVLRGGTTAIQPDVRRNFDTAVGVLRRLGHTIEEVALPSQPYGPVISLIIRAEGASAFRDLLDSGRCQQLRNGNDKWGGYVGAAVLAVDYLDAMRVRVKIRQALEQAFAPFDAVLAPSLPTVAYPIEGEFERAYPGVRGSGTAIIPASNLAGQPAITVPTGAGENNLPTGMQLVGKTWSEARLLALAQAYQRETEWHTRRPRLD